MFNRLNIKQLRTKKICGHQRNLRGAKVLYGVKHFDNSPSVRYNQVVHANLCVHHP